MMVISATQLNPVQAMRERWAGFSNTINQPLVDGWSLLDEVIEDNIRRNSARYFRSARCVAVPIPTGAGKSQFTIVKAAIEAAKPAEDQRGFLIVKELNADIIKAADQINELAKEMKPGCPEEAVQYHKEDGRKVLLRDLKEYPILCITHSALLRALGNLSSGENDAKWSDLLAFRGGRRACIIIDEEITPVSEYSIDFNSVHRLHFMMDALGLEEKFPDQFKAVAYLKEMLRKANAAAAKGPFPDRTVTVTPRPEWAIPLKWFEELRRELRAANFSGPLGLKDSDSELKAHEDIDSTLISLAATSTSGFWESKRRPANRGEEGGVEILTSRLLLPDDLSMVILDATCQNDPRYRMFGVEVLPVPEGSRRYDSVKLFIARGRAGKGFMVKNADKQMEHLIADLEERFKEEPNAPEVFIAVQKGVRKSLAGFKPKSFKMKVGHFGEFPGSNEFMTCSVAVIAGNPFRPQKWASQQIVAAQGPPRNDEWDEHRERRENIIEGVLAADLIQACNRISIRRATQPDGGCDPARIFMILPAGPRGDRLQEAIEKAMPGIDCSEEWKLKGCVKRLPKRTEYEAQLVEAIADLKKGCRVAVRDVERSLGIRHEDFIAFIQRIKKNEPTDPITQAMKRHEVTYQAAKKGRGKKAAFHKKEQA